jgi:hypothetical protein
VQSGAVLEGLDVVEDRGASLGAGGEAVMIDEFVFEAAPERLDEGVIVAVGLATHGSEQSVLGQDLPVSRAGKLGSTIRVDDKASSVATLAKRHAQGADDESGIQDLTHGPADHPSGEDIQDRDYTGELEIATSYVRNCEL